MDYMFVLEIHNWGRWAVIAAGGWAVGHAWAGRARGASWGAWSRLPGLVFATAVNLQLVVGFNLYFNSPYIAPVFSATGYALTEPAVTFFTIVHPMAMIAAAAWSQLAYSAAKTAPEGRQFTRAANGYSVTLGLVLGSVPWPFLAYGRPLTPGG